ncbi:hypothetical protein NEF87_003181 [Candidatus Lokiarchaeum ossiferum]|uniref:Uncharacterized protein n=1 Tax=Candidatus Lokiarchaeum ossiferum TaxID=2951803 RepID=A0ABY6HU03_9ARCH|nr:hypothetical protein NEF87_003181 [Candidatus Lokiarchaeum sp. B-35]
MNEKITKDHKNDCECDLPEVRDSFKDGNCSKEQIIKCHGHEMVIKLEKEGKIV